MAQQYYTTVSRYVDGKYVAGTPDHPALVNFPDDFVIKKDAKGNPEDRTLIPVALDGGKPALPEQPKLKAPYAEVRRGPPGRMPINKGGARPSDSDPA